ncbi:putative secreted lipase [Lachnellula suecica]|uniref:Carboxylic ester hydrolase n=1 Tax=Lachnellula suecica TaxID=602035 RepID=A0A8T9CAE0_9HELO|nr:putative secreted lipase [Lachnellula suecica]
MRSLIGLASCLIPLAVAAPQKRTLAPTVEIEYATVVGSSLAGIDSFKGVPYAQPPTGSLRLKPPQPITSSLGTVIATSEPQACPQMYTSLDTSSLSETAITLLTERQFVQDITVSGEDCLTVNVQRPSSATSSSLLPVVFWIFGGGFEFGSTQTYDASEFISTSVSQGKDVIYVSVNYRLGGFGFLGGSEVKADGSSNLGLLDQRLGLEWVADNFAKFGGDPTKVTIWGESAGSISVFDQMALYGGNITYKGKPLFRGGIMDSGSLTPADPVDCPKAQAIYDTVVSVAGCSTASDILACLRTVDYTTFLRATQSVPAIFDYESIALSYLPRPDRVVLVDSPEVIAENGAFASVPFIVGDQEDEGTLFSLSQSNLSTTADVVDYLNTVFFVDATEEQACLPEAPNARISLVRLKGRSDHATQHTAKGILGDLTFTLTRRVFLNISAQSHPSVPSWSYLASYDYGTAVLGTFHASDILTAYGITPGVPSSTIQAYYISFINTLDPNNGTSDLFPTWPEWAEEKQLLNFQTLINELITDDFRSESYDLISTNAAAFHV